MKRINFIGSLTFFLYFVNAAASGNQPPKEKLISESKLSNLIQPGSIDNAGPKPDSSKKSMETEPELDFQKFGLSKSVSEYLNKIYSSSFFLHGFVASLAVIIVSELGDKTFFIAAIMAMRHPRATVLSGALSALAIMTVLAALVGHILSMIPRTITYYASSVLFLIFGVKMFMEASKMSDNEGN